MLCRLRDALSRLARLPAARQRRGHELRCRVCSRDLQRCFAPPALPDAGRDEVIRRAARSHARSPWSGPSAVRACSQYALPPRMLPAMHDHGARLASTELTGAGSRDASPESCRLGAPMGTRVSTAPVAPLRNNAILAFISISHAVSDPSHFECVEMGFAHCPGQYG